MSAISEWRDFRNFLKITHRVIRKEGNGINVGENFTLRITVTNTASGSSCHNGRPQIQFRNIQVGIGSTRFARPASGSSVNVSLNDQLLTPGDSGSVDVQMTAIDDLPGFSDWFEEEHAATVSVHADLDQNAYFRICQHQHIRQEIDS